MRKYFLLSLVLYVLTACAQSEESGHEFVDLGLSSGTLWATCNIGADSVTGLGQYFAWGEVKTKQVYAWSTYKWSVKGDSVMTKYCSSTYCGKVDLKYVLLPTDDVATVLWGSEWCMPTFSDLDELQRDCQWSWQNNYKGSGVNGCLVVGPNGNSLFFPAAGKFDDDETEDVNVECNYWTSSVLYTYNEAANVLNLRFEGSLTDALERCEGCSVRPVKMRSEAPE